MRGDNLLTQSEDCGKTGAMKTSKKKWMIKNDIGYNDIHDWPINIPLRIFNKIRNYSYPIYVHSLLSNFNFHRDWDDWPTLRLFISHCWINARGINVIDVRTAVEKSLRTRNIWFCKWLTTSGVQENNETGTYVTNELRAISWSRRNAVRSLKTRFCEESRNLELVMILYSWNECLYFSAFC